MTSADQPPPSVATRWVPFAEAQRILGMSEGSLRRAIRDGSVTGEQRRRNPDSATDQRMVYEVLVSDPPAVTVADVASEAPSAPEPATTAPDAITGLLELVAAEREERVRLTATLVEQAETIGRLRAEWEQALADTAAARAELARLTEAREQAARSWLDRLLGRK